MMDQWATHTFRVVAGERYQIEVILRENLEEGPTIDELMENLEQLIEGVRGAVTVKQR